MFEEKAYPQYHLPLRLVCKIITSILFKSSRNFKNDAAFALGINNFPIKILGDENIPKTGPAIITMNHYARDGFFIIWAGLAIAAHLPDNQMWLMTNAWTHREKGMDLIRTKVTKRLFQRIADMYGFITTPPMPPVEGEMVERALSVRAVFQHIRKHPETTICLAPEGRDFPYRILGHPPAGTGKFIYQLAHYVDTIIPVGVYEAHGKLVLDFGTAYGSSDFHGADDENISQFVMEKIARQLPSGYKIQ